MFFDTIGYLIFNIGDLIVLMSLLVLGLRAILAHINMSNLADGSENNFYNGFRLFNSSIDALLSFKFDHDIENGNS